MNVFPATIEKKVKLLNYLRNYMMEHLLKAGAAIMKVLLDFSGSFIYI
jgi:hypothetical protein